MSDLLKEFTIFSKISDELKKSIEYFHVFNCGKSVLFITIDDKVYGCGVNKFGQLGFGHQNYVKSVREINELKNKEITQFHIGLYFVIALSNNNKLFVWGENDCVQLGRGVASKEISKPSSIEMFDNVIIKQIVIHNFIITILTDKKIYIWIHDGYKKCNNNNNYDITPIKKSFPRKVIIESIFVNYNKSFAIGNNGNVYTWDKNDNLPTDTLGRSSKLSLPKSIRNVKYIGFNELKTIFLTKDYKLYLTENFDRFEEVNCSGHIIDKIITYNQATGIGG